VGYTLDCYMCGRSSAHLVPKHVVVMVVIIDKRFDMAEIMRQELGLCKGYVVWVLWKK
jgi:hypothetical protein